MVTSAQRKKSSNGAAGARKASPSSTARKPMRRSAESGIPGWTATVASIVGAGIAVGVGLYATRRQWLPKAGQWGEDLNDRFHDLRDRYASNDIDDDKWSDEQDFRADDTIGEAEPTFPDAKSAA